MVIIIRLKNKMNAEKISKLNKNNLIEKYVKLLFLIEFFTSSWMRWTQLLDNANSSVEILEEALEILENEDKESINTIKDFKDYYEQCSEYIEANLESIASKVNKAQKVKAVLHGEICRRNINYEIGRFKETMENRIYYYKNMVEDDV
jgi:hypothetical protein